MYEAKNKASQKLQAMFYIQVVDKFWDTPESPVNKRPPTSKPSEVEAQPEKSFQFAKTKTTDYIRNTQQIYYLESRLFS
jgi:hypothetical protein